MRQTLAGRSHEGIRRNKTVKKKSQPCRNGVEKSTLFSFAGGG